MRKNPKAEIETGNMETIDLDEDARRHFPVPDFAGVKWCSKCQEKVDKGNSVCKGRVTI